MTQNIRRSDETPRERPPIRILVENGVVLPVPKLIPPPALAHTSWRELQRRGRKR